MEPRVFRLFGKKELEFNSSGEVPMVEVNSLELTYPNGHCALQNVNLRIEAGEFVFLVGSTGSGKSSLLKLFYRELAPSRGSLLVGGVELADLARGQVPFLRRRIGVIFQDFRLLTSKTAAENVAYALEITGTPRRRIPARVAQALELVGLADKAKRLPGQLSGGEQQRVAIARALVNEPNLLLADEPTGNLDPDSTWDVMQILSLVQNRGTTVVVATHNQQVVDLMQKRVLVMKRGHLVNDLARGCYRLDGHAHQGAPEEPALVLVGADAL
jgi:cell division transport system ATP-binding protein